MQMEDRLSSRLPYIEAHVIAIGRACLLDRVSGYVHRYHELGPFCWRSVEHLSFFSQSSSALIRFTLEYTNDLLATIHAQENVRAFKADDGCLVKYHWLAYSW